MIRLKPGVCYDKSKLFKPEWAYATPKGFRTESFVLPFSFSVLANGAIQENYPWHLDTDVPWIFRAAVFPQIGTAQSVNAPAYNVGTPGLVRIRDTEGNPLTNCKETQDCVLAFGAVGQSGFNNINASGFPFGCGVDCERGGVITFDFILPSVAVPASLLVFAGYSIQAVIAGPGGDNITVAFVAAGINTPLSVSVVGNAITVNLATNGGGVATSTYSQTAAAILASAAASALVTVIIPSPIATVANTFSATALTGGATVSYVNMQGTILGDKIFEECAA
jgi:hypothetical protein